MLPAVPKPRSARPRLLGGLVAALLALSVFSPSAAVAAPRIGLQWSDLPRYERVDEWDVLQRSKTSFLRLSMEPAKSGFGSWVGSYYDKVFTLAAERNIAILPQLAGLMTGANTGAFPTKTEWEGSWKEWVRSAVKRYGYGGTFWSEHPGLPPMPVFAWELWNEPNLWGPTRGEAAEYGRFLGFIGPQIQNASEQQGGQRTSVLFGGLSLVGEATGYQLYVKNAYKAFPGLSGSYSGLAIHPYHLNLIGSVANTAQLVVDKVKEVRGFLDDPSQVSGAAGKSLWITELGWSVGWSPALVSEESKVTEAQQAELLTASFERLKGVADRENLQAITWFNDRDAFNTQSPSWALRSGLRDEVGNFRAAWFAFQGQTGAAAWPVSKTAFQANTETLWTYSRLGGGANSILGMSNSSPAIGRNKGAWTSAFRANTGTLFVADPAKAIDTKLAVAAGTSPAISALGGGAIAFQANTGKLWTYQEFGAVGDTGFSMAAGTSPAITELDRGGLRYPIAFQGSTGTLWLHDPIGGLSGWNSLLKMAPGTSPSIAALNRDDGRKAFIVVYQAADGTLSFMEPEFGVVASTGLGMAPGTSPAVTSLPGGKFAIAFQANTSTMWIYQPGGAITNTGFGMQAGTSPSVTAIHDHPNGLFQVNFITNAGQLWTYEPGGFVTNTLLGSRLGTSPSVAPG